MGILCYIWREEMVILVSPYFSFPFWVPCLVFLVELGGKAKKKRKIQFLSSGEGVRMERVKDDDDNDDDDE